MGGQNARISLDSRAGRLGGLFQLEGYGGLGRGQDGWPECKDFPLFPGGKAGPLISGGELWRLRAGSVWVARMQGFPNTLDQPCAYQNKDPPSGKWWENVLPFKISVLL